MRCLIIRSNGQVICIYTEDLDLSALGPCSIRRASHVEPDGHGRWWADLGPAGGPLLGPFERRGQALAAEEAWFEGVMTSIGSSQPAPGIGEGCRAVRRIPIDSLNCPEDEAIFIPVNAPAEPDKDDRVTPCRGRTCPDPRP